MDITVLKEQIMKKELSNFYVFTGIELGIQKIYLEQMSKVFDLPITRADSVLSIYSKCTSKSLFGSSKAFYVIRDDTDFMKQEKMYETIQDDIGENIIVLLYEKIDSRLKFGKFFKDCTVPFEKLSENVLISYIKRKGLSNKFAAELSNKVNGSYDLAMFECDKINQYAQAENIQMDEAMKRLLDGGVIYQPEESDVFQFTDAFMRRQDRLVFHLSKVLMDSGIQTINILGTLYNTMKSTMLIQLCNVSNVCDITGLDNKQVYFNKKYVGNFEIERLVYGVKLIARVVDDIKSGRIDEKFSLYYIIVKILG